MAVSQLMLYNTNLTPAKNAWIDDIETYLNTRPSATANNFQYQKIELDMTAKVSYTNQTQSMWPTYNYVRIYQDGKFFYFFILNVKWIAQATMELTLSMDTVNTFSSLLQFKNTTKIIRQHKDRFIKQTNVPTGITELDRVVDYHDEGMNGLPMFLKSRTRIEDETAEDYKWYLVYTGGEDEPVNCYLTADEDYSITVPAKSEYVRTDFIANNYYHFSSKLNNGVVIEAYYGSAWHSWPVNTGTSYVLYNNGTNLLFYTLRDGGSTSSVQTTKIRFTTNNKAKAQTLPINLGITPTTSGAWATFEAISDGKPVVAEFLPQTSTFVIDGINSIDRSLSKIVKIIECPYCPVSTASLKSDTWQVDIENNLGHAGTTVMLLKLVDLSHEFANQIAVETELDTKVIIPALTSRSTMPHNRSYESKLLNSSFTQYNYTYDSFTNNVKLENCTLNNFRIPIYYVQSNGIRSTLLFDIAAPLAKRSDVHETILMCNRNNELPIYNNEYLNYLRTGYNYDVKNKEQQAVFNWLGTGIQIAGSVAGVIAGTMTGNPIAAASAISLGTSAVASIANNINQQLSNNNAIQAKIDQLKAQSASINGADDLSLLNYYNAGNKLYRNVFSIDDDLKTQVYDLFRLCGYAVQTNGIPDTTSRYWYNFIQCEPEFITNANPEWLKYIDDVKARFKAGITRYHNHNNTWDLGQINENFESWLL